MCSVILRMVGPIEMYCGERKQQTECSMPFRSKCNNGIATAVSSTHVDRRITDLVALQNALNSNILSVVNTASVAGGAAGAAVKSCGWTSATQSAVSSAAGGGGKLATTKCERYKTELCRTFDENGTCRYGDKCQFAHGAAELRTVARHPKYKTDLCRTFHTTGFCPYGSRCHFIHSLHERHVPVQQLVLPVQSADALLPPQLDVTSDRLPPVQANGHVVAEKQSLDNLLRILSSLLETNHVGADRTAASLLAQQRAAAEFLPHHAALRQGSSYVSDAISLSTDSASPCPSPTPFSGVSDDLSIFRPYFAVNTNAHVLRDTGFQSPVTVPANVLTPPGSPGSAASSLNSFSSDFDGYDVTSSTSVWPALASPMKTGSVSKIPEFAHLQLLTSKHSLFA